MNSLGDRIKESRNRKKISQTELGNYVGVGKTTISNYETGYSSPDPETLAKIAEFLNVTTDYLLGVNSPTEKIASAIKEDVELLKFWDELKEREDLQLLFKQSKELSPKSIQQIIRIIKAIEDEEDRENE